MLNRRHLLLGLTTAPLLAQKLSKIEERGKQVVDDALVALGGPAYLAMRDRVENGRAYSFHNDRMIGLSRARISTRYPPRESPACSTFCSCPLMASVRRTKPFTSSATAGTRG